jgi:hypothetical protein
MRRPKPRPGARRWTVPTSGVRSPARVGWQALLDLEPGELLCVQWLLRRLERRQHVGPRALALECGIRRKTAGDFLKSPWRAWATSVIQSGTAAILSQVTHTEDILCLQAELRETLGTSAIDALAPARQRVERR